MCRRRTTASTPISTGSGCSRPYPASSLDARANWWGANGGAGSNGARPGAANPVNGLWFGHIDWAAGGAIVEDPPPDPNWINTADPLQLGCSMPANVTANTPVPLTGRVPGMPAVDRPASTSPWFESIHIPLMAAGVSGVPGSTFGFDQPPTNGISGGQVIQGGGSLTGVLVATAAGAGAGHVALDSEQVACPFQAAPAGSTSTRRPTRAPRAPGTWSRSGSRSSIAATPRSAGCGPATGRRAPALRPIDAASAARIWAPTVPHDSHAAAGPAPDIPCHLPAAHQRHSGDRHQRRERGDAQRHRQPARPRPGPDHDRGATRRGSGLRGGGGARPRARGLLNSYRATSACTSR